MREVISLTQQEMDDIVEGLQVARALTLTTLDHIPSGVKDTISRWDDLIERFLYGATSD